MHDLRSATYVNVLPGHTLYEASRRDKRRSAVLALERDVSVSRVFVAGNVSRYPSAHCLAFIIGPSEVQDSATDACRWLPDRIKH